MKKFFKTVICAVMVTLIEEGSFDFEEIKKRFEKKLKEKHSKEVKLDKTFIMTM